MKESRYPCRSGRESMPSSVPALGNYNNYATPLLDSSNVTFYIVPNAEYDGGRPAPDAQMDFCDYSTYPNNPGLNRKGTKHAQLLVPFFADLFPDSLPCGVYACFGAQQDKQEDQDKQEHEEQARETETSVNEGQLEQTQKKQKEEHNGKRITESVRTIQTIMPVSAYFLQPIRLVSSHGIQLRADHPEHFVDDLSMLNNPASHAKCIVPRPPQSLNVNNNSEQSPFNNSINNDLKKQSARDHEKSYIICWEWAFIPALIEQLAQLLKGTINDSPKEQFNVVWKVTCNDQGAQVQILQQQLVGFSSQDVPQEYAQFLNEGKTFPFKGSEQEDGTNEKRKTKKEERKERSERKERKEARREIKKAAKEVKRVKKEQNDENKNKSRWFNRMARSVQSAFSALPNAVSSILNDSKNAAIGVGNDAQTTASNWVKTLC